MNNTLTFFNNLQYDPIQIDDFCIVEVYKNSISDENILGYYIQPLNGVTNPKETIANRVKQLAAVDLDGLAILPGRELNLYSHKVVYAVFYDTNDAAPIYPLMPDQVDLGTPANPLDIYETIEIENEGTLTDCTINLALAASAKEVEFFINDQRYFVDISNYPRLDNATMIISKNGVSYGSLPIDSFKFSKPPQLEHGVNILRVNKIMVSDIEITYTRKY